MGVVRRAARLSSSLLSPKATIVALAACLTKTLPWANVLLNETGVTDESQLSHHLFTDEAA